jgi:hypothetical protein
VTILVFQGRKLCEYRKIETIGLAFGSTTIEHVAYCKDLTQNRHESGV